MIKRVVFSPEAIDDTDKIIDFLDENASPTVALRFYDAIQKSAITIAETPGVGALRDFDRIALRGMRMYVINEFPNHLIFYLENKEVIEVIRVLDGRRDLPELFNR